MDSPRQIALDWISDFSVALGRKDVQAICKLFLPDGWLRDCLVFSWNVRSLEGRERIGRYLSERLPRALIDPRSIKLDEENGLVPTMFALSDEVKGVEAAFVFEAPAVRGRGLVRLRSNTLPRSDEDEPKNSREIRWKALSVYLTVHDIKGYEEAGHELGLYGGHTIAWSEVITARQAAIEADPQVLIIGAGQTGLQVAARFKQMNIRTVVVERNERIGDNWRKRYPTLSLNTPRTHHTLLYAPYPHNWPTFTPRDKIASWLEHYAESQDLVVWTSTFPLPTPEYDYSLRRWDIMLSKHGSLVTLHPKHIVLATGTLGDPYVPSIPSLPSFRGVTLHASAYAGGREFSGKRVLIIGAGTTAADLAQDLHTCGASSITMFQRHPTCVVSRKLADLEFQAWPEGVPYEMSDFRVAAIPLGLASRIAKSSNERAKRAEFDAGLRAGLEAKGFRTTDGPSGGGRRELVYERLGGLDVGAAELIINGAVSVKSGAEIARFDDNGTTVLFSDSSSVDVEVVIFATGYENIRPSMEKLFGKDTIEGTSEVWGLDEEGELRGCYRPSGHPGLWYAAGDFFHSRYMSKQLALLIKAEELALTRFENLVSVPAKEINFRSGLASQAV
ncbi:hypothetical protein ACEPAH_2414 [Sanghuangporus vaninii]